MNGKDRKTLKEYFKKGKIPTEGQFAELIDSVPNRLEDGQVVGTATGWAFYPRKSGRLDIGLHTVAPDDEAVRPVWSVAVTPEKKLIISNENGEAVVEAAQDKSLLLHGSLTVENNVTAQAFLSKGGGVETPGKEVTLPADKQWYDLPLDAFDVNDGCRVYSVYASYYERVIGFCQLTRITALRLDSMEQRIESSQKHWWGWSGGIRFRWQTRDGKNCLQMRTKKRLPGVKVHCLIVEMYRGLSIKNRE